MTSKDGKKDLESNKFKVEGKSAKKETEVQKKKSKHDLKSFRKDG